MILVDDNAVNARRGGGMLVDSFLVHKIILNDRLEEESHK